jgi:hypothetical protein
MATEAANDAAALVGELIDEIGALQLKHNRLCADYNRIFKENERLSHLCASQMIKARESRSLFNWLIFLVCVIALQVGFVAGLAI